MILESRIIFLIGYFQKNFSEKFGKSGKYPREDDSRGETVILRWSSFMVGSHGRGFLGKMDMVGRLERGVGIRRLPGVPGPLR